MLQLFLKFLGFFYSQHKKLQVISERSTAFYSLSTLFLNLNLIFSYWTQHVGVSVFNGDHLHCLHHSGKELLFCSDSILFRHKSFVRLHFFRQCALNSIELCSNLLGNRYDKVWISRRSRVDISGSTSPTPQVHGDFRSTGSVK